VVNTIAAAPHDAAVGLGIVLLGLPAFFLWSHSRRAAP
jgi:hypothetical protein